MSGASVPIEARLKALLDLAKEDSVNDDPGKLRLLALIALHHPEDKELASEEVLAQVADAIRTIVLQSMRTTVRVYLDDESESQSTGNGDPS